MITWEYKQAYVNKPYFDSEMTKLGKEGWECFKLNDLGHSKYLPVDKNGVIPHYIEVYLKRPIQTKFENIGPK